MSSQVPIWDEEAHATGGKPGSHGSNRTPDAGEHRKDRSKRESRDDLFREEAANRARSASKAQVALQCTCIDKAWRDPFQRQLHKPTDVLDKWSQDAVERTGQ